MSMKDRVKETGCGAAGSRARLFVLRSSAFVPCVAGFPQ
jgi:hypothetical protein